MVILEFISGGKLRFWALGLKFWELLPYVQQHILWLMLGIPNFKTLC